MLKPNAGRALSAAGAILLLISLALTWYHVERPSGIDTATGFESFPRLRWIVAAGALLVIVSAALRQTRPALIARTVLGVVVGALILRRIIDPPDLSSPVVPQAGMYIGLVAAIMAALGGLVDTGREIAVVSGLGRFPRAELPPAGEAAAVRHPRTPERAPGATATRGS
jgi:hypothetical protein